MNKKASTNRIRLTDHQCRLFLKDMREFGYEDLTFATVRKLADEYAEGADHKDVIGMIMAKQIAEANERR